METDKKGFAWIFLGLLLITAAFLLTGYNLIVQYRAKISSQYILEQMEIIGIEKESSEQPSESNSGEQEPLYRQNPEMEMPVETVDGYDYIGTLELPALSLKFPVMSQWDYDRLQLAPCRYTGSVYQNNLVICAHNYVGHFLNIKSLQAGDIVIFTDVTGNIFRYQVIEMEILQPDMTEQMASGDWDLTFFTCTVGGASRITVRCELIEDIPAE